MNKNEIEEIELDLFLEAIFRRYGYDFSQYARSSIKRRVKSLARSSGFRHISEMIPRALHDASFIKQMMNDISITVTEMFRDPWVFKTIRDQVLPKLKIFPRINIWHAGCATGEEVYSMAILLKEEGLLENTQIYATDFNDNSLEIAKRGIYPLENFQKYTKNYLEAGGKQSFSDYYYVKYNSATFDKVLKECIVFTSHNLAEDRVFAEMHFIICRNVLIYFKQTLQEKVVDLFEASLAPRGFLLLGLKESLKFSKKRDHFEIYANKEKIYRVK